MTHDEELESWDNIQWLEFIEPIWIEERGPRTLSAMTGRQVMASLESLIKEMDPFQKEEGCEHGSIGGLLDS